MFRELLIFIGRLIVIWFIFEKLNSRYIYRLINLMFPRKIILFFVQLFPILVDSLVIQIPSETAFGPQNQPKDSFRTCLEM